MNTIMYVLNDKVYVYRIAQMREYELVDYIRRFFKLPGFLKIQFN